MSLRTLKVTFIGYGKQGRAQALNLKRCGVVPWVVLREGSQSRAQVVQDGLSLVTIENGLKEVDLVVILTPDETQGDLYHEIEPHLKIGASLCFGHGYAIHFGLVKPRSDLNVFLVAPKVSGAQLQENSGVSWPTVVAIHQDPSGQTLALAREFASAVAGSEKIILSTFQEEAVTNLFSEQAVILGGVMELLRAGFNTLVKGGYTPEVAYYECVDKIQIIGDLIHRHGIEGMLSCVSHTAEWGARVEGPHVIDNHAKKSMEDVLERIENGGFSKSLQRQKQMGFQDLGMERANKKNDLLEMIGKKLRVR